MKKFLFTILISPANFFSPNHPNYWKELYGKIRAFDIINKGESMNFDHVYMHPLYVIKEQYDDFDIAILKYRESIKLFWHLRPLCVPHTRKCKIKFKFYENLSLYKIYQNLKKNS